jgi:hypothetical protein
LATRLVSVLAATDRLFLVRCGILCQHFLENGFMCTCGLTCVFTPAGFSRRSGSRATATCGASWPRTRARTRDGCAQNRSPRYVVDPG